MPLVAVPNVSEGRDTRLIEAFGAAITSSGARLLDVDSDAHHHRSVFTAAGSKKELVDGMAALADACRVIDLTTHDGVHPRLGALDVCPFVPFEDDMEVAIDAARATGDRIGGLGIPVFFYGGASRGAHVVELPSLRSGGLEGLARRMGRELEPDAGPADVNPRTGVVCVGARGPLIAFNVLLDGPLDAARAIVQTIRHPEFVRALAFTLPAGPQVSMNLIEPGAFGIDEAFRVVAEGAAAQGVDVVSTEIVGLIERRFLPDPDAQAARLLIEPGRSLESALRA